MRFGSVCSGIEAASVAWHPMGWQAAWLAEIEPFPCSLLDHHYPNVKNYGDMTALPERIRTGKIEAPDVLCGGTPCQAFSVAGLRRSLDDARGNLSLTFCEIANAIDTIRGDRGEPECIIVWENVPGVLSTKDNAFGCFLAGLAGESEPLQPSGKKWTNAGCVFGPQRAVAWRILDAQYFGLAQRRRRVFVVASARKGFDPCAVLFESEGVRRDIAPSREKGEGVAVCPTLRAGGNGTGGDRPPGTDVDTADSLQVVSVHGTQDPDIRNDQAHTLGRNQGQENAICVTGKIAHTLKAEGHDGSEDGTGRGVPVIAFDTTQITHPENRSNPKCGDPCHTLPKSGHAPAIAAMAVSLRGREGGATAELGDEVSNCLRASGGGGDKAHVLAPVACMEVAGTMKACKDSGGWSNSADHAAAGYMQVMPNMQVRRLTPRECERLQGFPDDYTLVPHRGKPAADGPRYKALGNSWAVPVVAWIGRRIAAAKEKGE